MLISPQTPTRIYIIFSITGMLSNNVATKLKSNNPINPQLTAPIIVTTRAIFCNKTINSHPFVIILTNNFFNIHVYFNILKIYLIRKGDRNEENFIINIIYATNTYRMWGI